MRRGLSSYALGVGLEEFNAVAELLYGPARLLTGQPNRLLNRSARSGAADSRNWCLSLAP